MQGRIILQDLPQVIAIADVEDGIQLMSVDFFEGQPIKCKTLLRTALLLKANNS